MSSLPFYVVIRFLGKDQPLIIVDRRRLKISTLRNMIWQDPRFGVPLEEQRLIFRGNPLEDKHDLYEYSISMASIVELYQCIKATLKEAVDDKNRDKKEAEKVLLSENYLATTTLNGQNSATADDGERSQGPWCERCLDNPKKKCQECSCQICFIKRENDNPLMCDQCEYCYHHDCVGLDEIPNDDWYCPSCKNDANEINLPGGERKKLKKRMETTTDRANNGQRAKECTIVPKNHIGPIPQEEVGQCYYYRLQLSEAGVHRPLVHGMAGDPKVGAYSIVSSGGYEDDADDGDSLLYTGHGGRDLSGNKRTNDQSKDQTLDIKGGRENRALAMSCNAPLDTVNGADAGDKWREGKGVRVVRGAPKLKTAKRTLYDPEEGYRYDGIYKVKKYFPQKGAGGFTVWRYEMRRDDPVPAPWTVKGKRRIQDLGLTMRYPYLGEEVMKMVQGNGTGKEHGEGSSVDCSSRDGEKICGKKRSRDDSDEPDESKEKITRVAAYKLPENVEEAISQDSANKKEWDECKILCLLGKKAFEQAVMDKFTDCSIMACPDNRSKWNILRICHPKGKGSMCGPTQYCFSCAQRSFYLKRDDEEETEGPVRPKCPICHCELSKDFDLKKYENENLFNAVCSVLGV